MIDLQKEINNCNKCGDLHKQAKIFLQKGVTPFIIIGESPAKDGWIVSGRAFYNTDGKLQASGRILAKLLDILGYRIEDTYFTECCKCIIEDRKMLDKCSSNCKPILLKQLETIDCKLILTMGKSPTQALIGEKIKRYSDYVGKTFNIRIGERDYKLLPIYHPSPLNPKGYKDNIPIFEKIKTLL